MSEKVILDNVYTLEGGVMATIIEESVRNEKVKIVNFTSEDIWLKVSARDLRFLVKELAEKKRSFGEECLKGNKTHEKG